MGSMLLLLMRMGPEVTFTLIGQWSNVIDCRSSNITIECASANQRIDCQSSNERIDL